MGSVKDLKIISEPQAGRSGTGLFKFSDRYSVFDWGEMPDLIENKGAALCMTGAWFFELLEKKGLKTHYQGLVDSSGRTVRLPELSGPSDMMQVSLLRVIRPAIKGDQYDYSAYTSGMKNYLIPLEIIYRNSLPEGSSVFKRLRNGSLRPEDIGLSTMPEPGTRLPKPHFDVSTKLESTDRYIDWTEAEKISGLQPSQMDDLKSTLAEINRIITSEAARTGLANEDGKIELGIDENGRMIAVDVLGTPDECRFTSNGIHASKELARIFYRKTSWFRDVEEAKKSGTIDWKKHVGSIPEPLPPRFRELISFIYTSLCNELTGKRFFETPPLHEIMKEIKEYL
jgi:phosphoribosylaminoimidazole-succinocarboxamide synthase